ncbi:MAG: YheU family protein [Deltaproteobacteria bacterium]|nr:YheU family protein [Deltaproteobacteria bacterium]
MRIPFDKLREEVLNGVIESFVLREGTDYGDREVSLNAKVEQIRRQLEKGDAQILYDSESESIAIVRPGDVPAGAE